MTFLVFKVSYLLIWIS